MGAGVTPRCGGPPAARCRWRCVSGTTTRPRDDNYCTCRGAHHDDSDQHDSGYCTTILRTVSPMRCHQASCRRAGSRLARTTVLYMPPRAPRRPRSTYDDLIIDAIVITVSRRADNARRINVLRDARRRRSASRDRPAASARRYTRRFTGSADEAAGIGPRGAGDLRGRRPTLLHLLHQLGDPLRPSIRSSCAVRRDDLGHDLLLLPVARQIVGG